MLRSRIRPDTSSSSDEIFAMQKAQAMGVTIWSTPWSPPAAWKSNNNVNTIVNGVDTMGYLLASHYQDYANWLKQYVINMANNGITIYAVSMQNEPNWSADYESARWSAQQFHDALSILHDTLAADSRTANVKIILPEEIHWNNLDLVSQVMSDPVESNYTNLIYADHTYGINTIAGGKDGFAPISGLNGHQIWETEHTGDDPGLGITAGLNEAQSIYDIVYIAQASAYHHWWTNATGGAGLLNGKWQTTKLYSGMAQFSKFIRPGWVAVGESDDNNGLRISAFKNPDHRRLRQRDCQHRFVGHHRNNQSQRGLRAGDHTLGYHGHARCGPATVDSRDRQRRQLSRTRFPPRASSRSLAPPRRRR